MNLHRKIKAGFSLLVLSVCVLSGAGSLSAQTPDTYQQQLDQLQQLQQQIHQQLEQLKQSQPTQPQPQQYQPQQYQPQVQSPAPTGSQESPVRLRPVDMGRSASLRIGGGSAPASGKTYDRFSIKTNLLYAATLTPNLSFEVGLSRKFTLELAVGYNGWGNFWKFSQPAEDAAKRQFDHILGKVEGRWWFRERFKGHFAGLHAYYTDYTVNGLQIPLLADKEFRYDGYGIGIGITYGYNWRWNDRWGMEFHLGGGVMTMRYDKFPCAAGCDETPQDSRIPYKKTYFGPTTAGIKLYFMIR